MFVLFGNDGDIDTRATQNIGLLRLIMERPSLERLKGLDFLPDLESQLQEARQLCTHSARCDMILRWLLDRLKASAEVRSTPGSWNLLVVTLRLLPLERLATLLGTADLVQIVQSTLHDGKANLELLGAVASCLDLLFELSNDEKGAALQAMLGGDPSKAGMFSGTWLRVTLEAIFPTGVTPNSIPYALLEPATQVWAYRKQRDNENEVFAKHLMVPAAALLAISVDGLNVIPTKRKRNDITADAAGEFRRTLETLLARHVFSPARLSFLDTQEKQRQYSKNGEPRLLPIDLSDRLDSVKSAIASNELAPTALPALLDVALRCTPAVNQRQRTKERPWVELVFATLLDCMVVDGKPKDSAQLVAMLAVIGRRAALSKETLLSVVDSYAKLPKAADDSGAGDGVEWALIARVIMLDASAFATTQHATRLFDALSRAEKEAQASRDPLPQLFDIDLSSLRQRDILIPVIQAFAKGRSLSTFIEIWHKQLLHDLDGASVWLQLGHSFSDLVETSLTHQQIAEIVERLRRSLTSDMTAMEIPANTVILQAVLPGIRSSDLLDAVRADVEAFFDELATNFDQYVSVVGSRRWHHSWRLLTTALNLWFPSWVAQQTDRVAVMKRASSILASEAVTKARGVLSDVHDDEKTVQDARIFVLTLVRLLQPYSTEVAHMYKQARKGRSADRLSGSFRAPVIHHVEDLESTHLELANEYFEERLGELSRKLSGDGPRPLLAPSPVQEQSTKVKAVVETALAYLRPLDNASLEQNARRASVAVQELLRLPSAALTIDEREHVLNAVAVTSRPHYGAESEQMRLALMIQSLEEPCLKAGIYSAASLWQQAEFASMLKSGEGTESSAAAKILELLECLATRVVGHLLHYQSRNAAKASLLAIAAAAEATIDSAASGNGFASDPRHLLLVKATFTQFDRHMRPELLQQCMRPQVTELYVSILVRDAETLVKEARADQEREMMLATVLYALANLPRRDAVAADKTQSLMHIVLDVVRRHGTDVPDRSEVNGTTDSRKLVLLRCLEFLARARLVEPADNKIFEDLTTTLLAQDLPPKEHAAVLSAFTTACRNADASTRIERLQALLPGNEAPSGASLLLLGVFLSTLSKEDFIAESSADRQTPQVFLHRLLGTITQAEDLTSCRRACECLALILKSQPFMTNQHTIEATLACMSGLAARRVAHDRVLFLDICRVAQVLLQQYGTRVRDRLHLVVHLLQTLLSCFFRKTKGEDKTHKPLTTRHARAMTRVLQLLCNPPQLRIKPKATDLVDESRKSQAHVGKYIQYVLHHYCSQVLKGVLGEGVREALMPGLWAMTEAMEINNADAVKILSSAMTNSERAVLRNLYDEYKTFGKWRGG
ncbi:hypothetical protein LTR91_015778 [Friedmanniomyces endolithicus]|uniref:Nucleolar 27S pre-rRNA processing Urb2/Npa2 C-terminal domain-containing protein n=1 Tax=Friedmanniomyces endolithicus TaxID=329885 RepID=A0AAN6K9D0_9PEZI|nr:hypothetical protein LTR94_004078 [Friedmanniomyces endolithicus]KAK0781911.1 hypothetical protein LTR59_012344 [Friedmanniomyces endolithicus]KAK0810798.1 hypothetical protein LTR38_003818 [Friedmanniomyces endolithicus]KAK0868514.1 hypothetical protein LTS02_003589 [Friedmanniomyces endolithicus]KAK0868845.1 hypothetical protein LTR87_013968 [Friedmanniomyces endolithicus]